MESVWFLIFCLVSLIHGGLTILAFFSINDVTGGVARYWAIAGWWPFYPRDQFETGFPLTLGRVTFALVLISLGFTIASD